MGKINRVVFRKQLGKKLSSSRSLQKKAYDQANKIFKKEIRSMVSEYNTHPVTKEIQAGPHSKNISNTLGGYGNLFSFIGFTDKKMDPTEPVRRLILKDSFLHRSRPIIRSIKSGQSYEFTFRATLPSKDDISKVSRMPWESGRSWVFAVESGISGLGHYIYRNYIKSSRSKKAIQSKNKYMPGMVYRPVSYVSAILNKFKKKVQ